MRRVAKTDDNQRAIVNALRGVTYMLEIKNSRKHPGTRQLTGDEKQWHAACPRHAAVVTNEEEALRVVGLGR